MKSKLAPWTLPDIASPIWGWRMLKGRLVAEGRLSPDLRRYIGLPIVYFDPVGKVAWTSDRNLMNDDTLKAMVRGLAAKMEDAPDAPRDRRLRAPSALEQCRNALVQQAQATKTVLSDDDGPPIYEATPGGLWWYKGTKDGIAKIPLTNFAAKITGQAQLDDGVETSRTFELETALKGRRYNFSVAAAEYSGLGWVTEKMGAEAIIFQGFAIKDNARAAIQILSGNIPERHVYTHTGWREVNGTWVYLHGSGAIGELGPVADIEVSLPHQL